MYVAKRRGGNQASHHEWPLPPSLDSFAEDETDYRRTESALSPPTMQTAQRSEEKVGNQA